MLSIGVSEYADSRINLKYADNDALKIAEMLSSQQGVLFREVFSQVLVNEKATREAILQSMGRFLGQAYFSLGTFAGIWAIIGHSHRQAPNSPAKSKQSRIRQMRKDGCTQIAKKLGLGKSCAYRYANARRMPRSVDWPTSRFCDRRFTIHMGEGSAHGSTVHDRHGIVGCLAIGIHDDDVEPARHHLLLPVPAIPPDHVPARIQRLCLRHMPDQTT